MPDLSDNGLEGDEMEMCKEELQKWIRGRVKKQLLSTGVLDIKKYTLIQSLLKKREAQATQLLKLCKSVAGWEAIVKKQYSLLQWEYRDIDSEDDDHDDKDDKTEGRGDTSPVQGLSSPAAKPVLLNLMDMENSGIRGSVNLKRKAVVALNKLPDHQIKPVLRPRPLSARPQSARSDDESFSDADTYWEPENDVQDSDHSITSYNSGLKKRRKIERKRTRPPGRPPKLQQSTTTNGKSNATSAPKASLNSYAKENKKKSLATKADANSNAKDNMENSSETKADANSNANTATTSKSAANTTIVTPSSQSSVVATNTSVSVPKGKLCVNMDVVARKEAMSGLEGKILEIIPTVPEVSPIIVSTAFAISPDEIRNFRPDLPEVEITVDMMVLARKKRMKWQRGKILAIISKADGHIKYKVQFEERGRSLVSGHHIAFDSTPNLEQLYVGARVVVNCQDNASNFQTAIMAELPTRRNRLRFLVFTDDHMPIYVGLPLLHLVCRPLGNSLDDLSDGPHKSFMTRYMRDWPCPHLTLYKAGQIISVDLNGVQEKCEVLDIDSSLMQVVYKESQEKEWIYRGSTRLEHMRRILRLRESEEQQQQQENGAG